LAHHSGWAEAIRDCEYLATKGIELPPYNTKQVQHCVEQQQTAVAALLLQTVLCLLFVIKSVVFVVVIKSKYRLD